MPATLERGPGAVGTVDVEVSDFLGQETLDLGSMASDTPVDDVLGISRARLQTPTDVDFLLRDTNSSSLLRSDQPIGDAARQGKVSLRMQPDARLG